MYNSHIAWCNGILSLPYNIYVHVCRYLSGNAPPCEGEFFIRLCPFLEDASATLCAVATPEGTEFLTLRDVCDGKQPTVYMNVECYLSIVQFHFYFVYIYIYSCSCLSINHTPTDACSAELVRWCTFCIQIKAAINNFFHGVYRPDYILVAFLPFLQIYHLQTTCTPFQEVYN
jgi:hypothetical protein